MFSKYAQLLVKINLPKIPNKVNDQLLLTLNSK